MRRARRTLDGALSAAESGHADTAVLAYINAAIHASDALCIFGRGEYVQGEDHAEAIALLAQVPDGRVLAKHLSAVIDAKQRWTYDVKSIEVAQLTRVRRAAVALVDEAERRA